MKQIIVVILITFFSCSNNEINIDELPIVKGGFGVEQDLSIFNKGYNIKDLKLDKELRSQNPSIKKLNALLKFHVEEMDSSKLRPYKIFLFESLDIKKKKENHIITLTQKSNELIDYYTFDSDMMKITHIYQHSSELEHDGIAIELLENKKHESFTQFSHYLEVFETGKIEFITKSFDSEEAFKHLKFTQNNTGTYSYSKNNLDISLELKDGLSPENYSYNLLLRTPKGCIHKYLNVDHELENNTIPIDTSGKFKLILENKAVRIKNHSFESSCDEIIKLNYLLYNN